MVVIGGRAHNIEEIHEVGNLEYPYAEISLDDPEEVSRQLDELLELKKKYHIYYLAHYPNEGNPVDTKALEERFIPKMKRLIELSRELYIHKGTIHFWMDKRWAEPSLISAKIKLLSGLVEYAKQNKVVLCIENLTEGYESFSTAFDAIPDLRMTMDIGHGELLSKENTSFGFMQNVFHKIDHIHVNDNHGGTSVKDDLHLALGDGIVDYPSILSMLKGKNYNSTITMEVKPSDMPRTMSLLEKHIY
ncbi:MAG: sugar phosphate isomerase/epimerase [Spirochaetota bacterium]|nr:sugar phosphate isomerase/epimerase [Spirochaetota bacterium]